MAKASAKKKDADASSMPTFAGHGSTMDLRALLRVGSHTPLYPTTVTYGPSQMPKRHIEVEYSPTSASLPTMITVRMPTGDRVEITTDKKVTIEFERDFVDATAFGDMNKTYQVNKGSFTIKGDL